jgi:signal transduction histidine kinase
MFQDTAAERGISLHVLECSPSLQVMGDSERIMQVLSNLVGNALKFVPRGGSIVLQCAAKDSEAVFSVTDTGPGIPREDLEKLFEKFWQRRRTDKRGVGLGLSIARGIVEAHGGRIWADSTVGLGSTFSFTIPAVSEPTPPDGTDQRVGKSPRVREESLALHTAPHESPTFSHAA